MAKRIANKSRSILDKFKKAVNSFKGRAGEYFNEDDVYVNKPMKSYDKKVHDNILKVEFSLKSIVKVVLVVALIAIAAYLFVSVLDVIATVAISILLAVAIYPAVHILEKRHIPRALSVLIVYLGLIFIFAFVLYSIIPIVSHQIIDMAKSIKSILESLIRQPFIDIPFFKEPINEVLLSLKQTIKQGGVADHIETVLFNLGVNLAGYTGNTFGFFGDIFSSVYSFMMVAALTFFFVIDAEYAINFFYRIIPEDRRDYVLRKASAMQLKIGYWVKGQFVLCFMIGVGIYAGLWIIQLILGTSIPYKETIAVVAGVFELIPFIGPIMTAGFILLVLINQGLGVFVSAIVLSVLIQQLENNLIVPIVMKKATGVPSLVIFIFLLIGAKLWGILGIFLAIPIASIVSVIFDDYLDIHHPE